jgi:putative sigma-54 modulation protein
MNYTENFEGIKMDVQAVDINISKTVQQRIREMITRLRSHISEVNWVDVYFKKESAHSIANRTLLGCFT